MPNTEFKTSNMKEYKREYNSNWYKKNKERKMEYQRQYRARKKEEAKKMKEITMEI